MRKTKKILVHKEAGSWVADGFVLPNCLVTVQDVNSYFDGLLGSVPFMVFFV